MKKILALLLAALVVCAAAACSSGNGNTAQSSAASEAGTSSQADSGESSADGENDAQKQLEELLEEENFVGIVYSEKAGKVTAAARGKLESGECELEEAIKLFEEGTKLSASCYAMLEKAEQKIINISEIEKTEE